MSIDVVRAVLLADPATQALVGDKIGPRDAMVDQQPPYIALAVEASAPFLSLQGSTGLNRAEIEVAAWSTSYMDATTVADAAKAAMAAAGHFLIHEPADLSAFQGDSTVYGHAYVFQVFTSDS